MQLSWNRLPHRGAFSSHSTPICLSAELVRGLGLYSWGYRGSLHIRPEGDERQLLQGSTRDIRLMIHNQRDGPAGV